MESEHKNDENQPTKRQKTDHTIPEVRMNEKYTEPSFLKTLSECFQGKKEYTFENGAMILNEPFTCCVLPDFLQPLEFVNKLKEEVDEVEVKSLLSDLYQYKQSASLENLEEPSFESTRNFFSESCLNWMKEVTDIPLTHVLSLSCSCYTYTDYLLCHDDELEGRRIAFIYYLTPEWKSSYGGTLDLFTSVDGQPGKISKSIVPAFNKFVFFEVSPASFHQVSEIISYRTRTAISGWFHGPPLAAFPRTKEVILFRSPDEDSFKIDYKQWINPIYLEEETQIQIRESFEESSEIELMDFLLGEKYDAVCEALNEMNIKWVKKGPVIKRNHEAIDKLDEGVPQIVRDCHALFTSELFFVILNNMTGVHLHPMCQQLEDKGEGEGEGKEIGVGKVSASFRQWKHGSYTLLDNFSYMDKPTLIASLHFNCKGYEAEVGGFTSYVSEGEKDVLLQVDPKPNSIALVYLTPNTGYFVKYINNRIAKSPVSCFHDIFALYREGT